MSSLSDFYNYGKVQIYFPNKVSKKVRLADLVNEIIEAYGGATTQPHHGIASYTLLGYTADDPPVDPGSGNMAINVVGEGDEELWMLVLNVTDKNGFYTGWMSEFVYFCIGFGLYDIWVYVHSKNNPAYYAGGFVYDVDVVEDEEERTLAYVLYWYPVLGTTSYDAEEDESTSETIPEGDEVIISLDFAPVIFGGGGGDGGPWGE